MYKKVRQTWAKHWDFAVWDLIVLTIAYYISCFMRFGAHVKQDGPRLIFYMSLVLILIYFCVSILGKNYKNILFRNRYQELRSVIIQVFVSYAGFTIFMYLTKDAYFFSRQVYVVSVIISMFLIYAERILWKRFLRVRRLKGKAGSRLLLIAESQTVEGNIYSIRRRRYNTFVVTGIVIVDQDMKGQEIQGVPIVANVDELDKYIVSEVVDEVLIDISNHHYAEKLTNFLLEAGITVHMALVSNSLELPNKTIEKLGGHVVLTTSTSVASGWQLVCKRLMDIVGAIIGLVITGGIYLFLAPKIKKIDPGPVFFSQERVGKNGRKFKIYKFRSMYMDAEARKKELLKQNEMEGLMFKMENDPRILPGIGQKMRDWSLDEFPQFLNVLKGEMSIVGTRPPTMDEYNRYEAHHKMRLSFKPGITGLWQISGRNNIKKFEDVLALDNQYIKGWNIRSDIKIIFKTIQVVLKREGSM